MFVPRIDTIQDLFDAVRPHLSKPIRFTVDQTNSEIVCTGERTRKRIVVNKATGACTLSGTVLDIYLHEDETSQLAGMTDFRIGARSKRPRPHSNARGLSRKFVTATSGPAGVSVTSLRLADESFFLESALVKERITYDNDKRIRVSKNHRPDVFAGLKHVELIGKTSSVAFVVSEADLIKKPQ